MALPNLESVTDAQPQYKVLANAQEVFYNTPEGVQHGLALLREWQGTPPDDWEQFTVPVKLVANLKGGDEVIDLGIYRPDDLPEHPGVVPGFESQQVGRQALASNVEHVVGTQDAAAVLQSYVNSLSYLGEAALPTAEQDFRALGLLPPAYGPQLPSPAA